MARGMIREEVTRSAHQKRARYHRKPACEECGATENLHTHHRDLNWRNDDPANLQTLCPDCHLTGKWHEHRRRLVHDDHAE